MKHTTVTNILLSAIVAMMVWEKMPRLANGTDWEGAVFNHTGMSVVKNAATGCSYQITREGSITPYIISGKPLCAKTSAINEHYNQASKIIPLWAEIALSIIGEYNNSVTILAMESMIKEQEQAKKQSANSQNQQTEFPEQAKPVN